MQYKASLIAVLGLTATTFAAPQLPAVRAVPSNTLSTLPIARDAQNLASPFSNANGAVAKAPVSKVPVPTKNGLVDVAANVHVARSTIAILDVAASIHACKKTVVSDVVSIHALIKSVGTAAAGQQGLAEEIISDLGLIASALTATVDGVLSQTLPTVVNIAVTEVAEVLAILADVQAIVFQIVQVLEVVVAGLVDSTLKLVDAELLKVYKLLNPALTPVLKYIGLVQITGDAILLQQITATVSGLVVSCNGLLGAKGLVEIVL